jgi:excinuclease UvrABC nuclease subunit
MEILPFDPADARAALRTLPERGAVFALYGEAANAQPYIGRTPNLRGRLERLLIPSLKHPKRLQLAGRVRRIAWRLTGSDFESLLLQFQLLEGIYGARALERMHLGAPSFVRFLGGNPYPRLTVTNRPSQKEAAWSYGPFGSRTAAERFAEETLKLFLLRRCTDDLRPDPSHPGCVYSEMKMCLAPCYQGCTDERYEEESAAVERFLATRGESRLVQLKTQRDEASADLEFEAAAAVHAQVLKAEAVRSLAPEIVRPMSELRAVILHSSANTDQVAVFLYEKGRLRGPAAFSTLGMRIQNEQSGSSSLFAQPMSLEPVPENNEQGPGTREQEDKAQGTEGQSDKGTEAQSDRHAARAIRSMLEERMLAALAELEATANAPDATVRQGHLALLKRWYYRPEIKRPGEIFFPEGDGAWPVKALLRGVGRIAAKSIGTPSPST